jgi:hypothetical protein
MNAKKGEVRNARAAVEARPRWETTTGTRSGSARGFSIANRKSQIENRKWKIEN